MQIITTNDGSHTLLHEALQVTYHSKYGAMQESIHVFINAGLHHYITTHNAKEVHILEMGFGTGLNALLSLQYAQNHAITIQYHTVETNPIAANVIDSLNYGCTLQMQHDFEFMHKANWGEATSNWDNFSIYKHPTALENFESSQQYDIIYYDAFAPTAQPHLWTTSVFEKIKQWMLPNAILVTYCSKGDVRRSLENLGFTVEKLVGPPGKREMLRAVKVAP